ncbi:hypothetical protein DFJ77DRAFT_203087 [Powellomyces hirtus]|nr:hypothetical protein DFJ77DRAFT_203087 [Powellomyces hirtus]
MHPQMWVQIVFVTACFVWTSVSNTLFLIVYTDGLWNCSRQSLQSGCVSSPIYWTVKCARLFLDDCLPGCFAVNEDGKSLKSSLWRTGICAHEKYGNKNLYKGARTVSLVTRTHMFSKFLSFLFLRGRYMYINKRLGWWMESMGK